MDAAEFVSAYRLDLKPSEIHRGDHSARIGDAQDWSYQFGRLLHARLSGQPADAMTTRAEFVRYSRWALGFEELEYNLMATGDDGLRALNEAHFHNLNRHMIGLWDPIVKGRSAAREHRAIRMATAQNLLAQEGVLYSGARANFIDSHDPQAWLEAAGGEMSERITGMMQELDAALVLIDVMRRHSRLTIVPAPLQFERTKRQTNVDFVVLDMTARTAVGVQVKTKVRQSHLDEADAERVVFVDGTIDLGNVKAMRTHRNQSAERVVAWPGIIAAKRMDLIPAHGKATAGSINTQRMLRLRQLARELVGDIQVDYRDIAAIIGQRITAKL